jgi:hypothetical protein
MWNIVNVDVSYITFSYINNKPWSNDTGMHMQREEINTWSEWKAGLLQYFLEI